MGRKKIKYDDYGLGAATDSIQRLLYNIAASTIRIHNVPEGHMPSSEVTSRILTENGSIAAFNTNIGLFVGKCVFSGVDAWGEQSEGSAEPVIVGDVPIYHDRTQGILPIVLWDQPNHQSIMPTLLWYIEVLGKLRQAIETCARWLKTPMIFIGKEEQEEVIRGLVNKIELGAPAVAILEGSIDIQGISITPTNANPAILEALHFGYDKLEAKLYSELGLPDFSSFKMAQQTKSEILLPILKEALIAVTRLDMHNQWCQRVNAIYGTSLYATAPGLGLIEQSITSSTGIPIHLQDINRNGIPDQLEGGVVNGE